MSAREEIERAQAVEARILSPLESLQAEIGMAMDVIEDFNEKFVAALVQDDGRRP